MKNWFYRSSCGLVSILGLAALLWSQITPGNPGFSYYGQMPLERSMSGGISQSYASSVGGVAFSRTAEPAVAVDSIALNWDAAAPDGSRLRVTLNGERLRASVYDWQLAPIAAFADSKYDAAFTMFGSLQDKNQEDKILARNGRVLNYHAAFLDTLIGLRLLQLDTLIEDSAIPGLIKGPDGAYILGVGEVTPNLSAEQSAAEAVSERVDAIENALNMKFRSYIVSDYNQKIQFRPDQGTLNIGGNLYYFCWRTPADHGFDERSRATAIEAELRSRMSATSTTAGFTERGWLIQQLLPVIREYAASYRFYDSGTVVDLAAMGELSRPAYLQRYSTAALTRLLVDLRAGMEANQLEYMEAYSDALSSEQKLLRAINPAVWDSGTTVMRYAAFFRYVKQKDPAGWARFLATVATIPVNPKVRTPTGMN